MIVKIRKLGNLEVNLSYLVLLVDKTVARHLITFLPESQGHLHPSTISTISSDELRIEYIY